MSLAVMLAGKDSGKHITPTDLANYFGTDKERNPHAFTPTILERTLSDLKAFIVEKNPEIEFEGYKTHRTVLYEVLTMKGLKLSKRE